MKRLYNEKDAGKINCKEKGLIELEECMECASKKSITVDSCENRITIIIPFVTNNHIQQKKT